MHKKFIIVLLISLILLPFSVYPWAINSISFFSPRPQGTNIARDYAGMWQYRLQNKNKKLNGYIEATPTYTRYLRGHRIADALFGTNTLKISGSQVPGRERQDLLADYFGLSPSFESIVQLKPRIQNGFVVFSGHIGFDNWAEGLYLDVTAPIGWTQWQLSLNEIVLNDSQGTNFYAGNDNSAINFSSKNSNVNTTLSLKNNSSITNFPAGYMAAGTVKPPIKSFKQALSGNVRFGDMRTPIKFGKISSKALSVHGCADVAFAFGWNAIQTNTHHLGGSLRLTLPTGNQPTSEFFFEPLLGNGRHIEGGIGFDGHVLLWEKDSNQELSIYGSINATHLFNAKQCRSFDLGCHHNQALSRYMLLKEFDAENQYTGTLTPLINHTTLPCSVKINIQTDILIMFDYIHKGYTCDIGYNGFIRSKEIIALHKQAFSTRTFGLKGIQNVSQNLSGTPFDSLSPIKNNQKTLSNTKTSQMRKSTLTPNNNTQSNATIFGNPLSQQEELADEQSPRYIQASDIDITSAASPRIITHKLFAHFGYRKIDCNWGQPFCGVGGEVEFEGVNPRNRTEPVHDTLGLWGLWLKCGVAL